MRHTIQSEESASWRINGWWLLQRLGWRSAHSGRTRTTTSTSSTRTTTASSGTTTTTGPTTMWTATTASSPATHWLCGLRCAFPFCVWVRAESCSTLFNQPPSIFPISLNFSESSAYCLCPRSPVSQRIIKKNFSVSNLVFAFCSAGSFCSFLRYCAININSIVSINKESIFSPSVYFDGFLIWIIISCHSL